VAARLARWQEERPGEWAALLVKDMSTEKEQSRRVRGTTESERTGPASESTASAASV
jgi:hypothetical protein